MFTGGILTVMVSDFNRSVQFYTETLGLTLKMRAGDGWAEIEAPGVQIGLHAAGPHGPQPGGQSGMSIGLMVDNLDQAAAALRARGVEVAPPMEGQGARLAFFHDPDQTPLYLFERMGGGQR